MTDYSADVAVVGAGIAGLHAAWRLARDGISVLVLEAAHRPGGRVLDQPLPGGAVAELGATWLGLDHYSVNALADELGLVRYDAQDRGDLLLRRGSEVSRYRGRSPGLDQHEGYYLRDALAVLRSQASTDDGRARLAGQTARSWIGRHVASPAVRDVLGLPIQQELCADPDEVPASVLLEWDADYFGIEHFLSDWERVRLRGGPSGLVDGMIRDIGAERVLLGEPVVRIRSGADAVEITTTEGQHQVRAVVLAVPPTLLPRIQLDPALPGHVDQMLQRVPMGAVRKLVAVYDRPFWRDEGLAGCAVAIGHDVGMVADTSPQDGQLGVLTGFVVGSRSRAWSRRSSETRRADFLAHLVALFGPDAAEPSVILEQDWTEEPWVRGGYGVIPVPGHHFEPDLLRSELRSRHPRVVLAGSEYATANPGYLDGAIESGRTAAFATRTLLGATDSSRPRARSGA